MTERTDFNIRLLADDETSVAARLLDEFNREFNTPTPGQVVLTARLSERLDDPNLMVLLASNPATGIAVVSFRPSVWADGPTAMLEELFVQPRHRNSGTGSALLVEVQRRCTQRHCDLLEINVDTGDVDAQRFYERHGFTALEPDTGEHALYYHRSLKD